MRSLHIHRSIAALAALGLLLGAGAAAAAELYASGHVGFSSGTGDGSGNNDLVGESGSGEDDDASPMYGGAFGIAVPLSQVVPAFDLPYWPGRSLRINGEESFRLPGWRTLIEAEAITGRDFEFSTPGHSTLTPYITDVRSTTFLGNVRLDVPIQAPLNLLFGRLPMLEPVTLYVGGGAGVGWNDISTSDTVNAGSDDSFKFAWQGGAGFGYAMSDTLHASFGYRYLDLGSAEIKFDQGPNEGKFDADIAAHEVTVSLRFHFYHIPFFGRE
jgi:opacity protein-like surface antigen